MTRKNPFRIIRIAASVAGATAVIALSVAVIWAAISKSVDESGPHILWQILLVALIFFGAVLLVGFACSGVAKLWRNAERRWDRKERS